jgi:hypothetical protein
VAFTFTNKPPYGHQLDGNDAHITPFQFNVSTAQTAPVAVNTKAAKIASPIL